MRRQADARRSISLRRFGEDLFLGNLWKLSNDLVPQMIVGQDPYPLRRQNCSQAVDCLLNKSALSEEAQDLFGTGLPTPGPETGTATARQNQAVVILFGHNKQFSVRPSGLLLERITTNQ